MADVPGRDELERLVARRFSGALRVQMMRLLEELGDPPNINNVSAAFWDEAGQELAAVALPLFENIYLEAAEAMLADNPIGVDWGLVNEAATSWARQYTFDLVSGINDTTRRQLQDYITGFFAEPVTMGQLRAKLEQLYNPVRAEMIAQTEVTRAAVQGELAIVGEIRKQGIEMVAIWETNDDEIVCPICSPLDGKKQGDGWTEPPPAHPRCRCWLNHEFMQ